MESLLLLIVPVHALACLSPGPDSLLTLRNTLIHGAVSGYATLAGILSGVSIHIALAIGGLSLVASQHPLLLRIIAMAGAVYFLHLGIRSMRAHPPEAPKPAPAVDSATFGQSFRDGLLTNLLNAKAILYFISVFSITFGADTGISLRLQIGGVMLVTQLVGFTLLIESARYLRAKGIYRHQSVLERLAAAAFVLFALVAALYALSPIPSH
ncbi:MAG: LysE family transporter [Opitutales bacterium]|nr:LysE family transporter [Opitutales bacterium]